MDNLPAKYCKHPDIRFVARYFTDWSHHVRYGITFASNADKIHGITSCENGLYRILFKAVMVLHAVTARTGISFCDRMIF
jgi:hypothetical protein